MARIDNDDIYEPRNWDLGPGSKVRNLWGSASSKEFGAAGVPFIEQLDV